MTINFINNYILSARGCTITAYARNMSFIGAIDMNFMVTGGYDNFKRMTSYNEEEMAAHQQRAPAVSPSYATENRDEIDCMRLG